jgi:hypothetical protein
MAMTHAHGRDVTRTNGWGSDVKSNDPPSISTLLKPLTLKKVLEDKEIVVHAALESLPDGLHKKYAIYASMLVNSNVREAYTALTDYKLYAELVPFVESAVFSPITHTLLLEGGIWNFRLSSQILFAEQLDRWIHFDILAGHFTGLRGNIYFESKGEKGTLVYLDGEHFGTKYPPTFIIEQGAEIVFGFTAQRMRSYIESTKKAQQGAKHGDPQQRQIPEPRNRL